MTKGKTPVKYRNLDDEDATAHSRVTPIGASNTRMHDYLGCSVAELRKALSVFAFIRFRDHIYQAFKVNRSEMWALIALHGYLEAHNKTLVSKDLFIDSLSGTFNQRVKFNGYVTGLITKQCLGTFEYIRNKNSLSIGITDFGFKVIDAYYQNMDELFVRYMSNRKDDYLKSISVAENIPSYYRPY